MTSFRRYSVLALTAAVAVMGGASAAKAYILAIATRAGAFTGNATVTTIPLTDSGATALAFKTGAANQKVVIRYNAECQGGSSGWVSVSIFVDGVQASPASGTDFALCTGGDYVGALRQSTFVVPTAGAHSVTITAQAAGGGSSWRLDDTSLTVEK